MIDRVQGRLAVAADFAAVTEKFRGIEGFLHPLEGYALMLLAAHGPGAGEVVEIGSYLGRSTCYLAYGAQRAKRPPVVAVDHFQGSPEHQPGASHESAVLKREGTTYGRFLSNLEAAGLSQHVRPVRQASLAAALDWRAPIRLLFIDGDHSYEATGADFAAWSPRVEPGGLVGFHDVDVWPGVTRFYNEVLAEGGWREGIRAKSLRVLVRDG